MSPLSRGSRPCPLTRPQGHAGCRRQCRARRDRGEAHCLWARRGCGEPPPLPHDLPLLSHALDHLRRLGLRICPCEHCCGPRRRPWAGLGCGRPPSCQWISVVRGSVRGAGSVSSLPGDDQETLTWFGCFDGLCPLFCLFYMRGPLRNRIQSFIHTICCVFLYCVHRNIENL